MNDRQDKPYNWHEYAIKLEQTLLEKDERISELEQAIISNCYDDPSTSGKRLMALVNPPTNSTFIALKHFKYDSISYKAGSKLKLPKSHGEIMLNKGLIKKAVSDERR